MERADLEEFPALQRAWDHAAVAADDHCFLGELVDQLREGLSDEITPANGLLTDLLTAFEIQDLDEQVRSLFRSYREWRKADTELRGLWQVHQHGALAAIGWPEGEGGNPPFDGVFKPSADAPEIPFDIKDAQGSGSQLLTRQLSEVARHWARTPDVTVEIRSRGTLTQPTVGPSTPQLRENLGRALQGTNWDGHRSREVEFRAGAGLVLLVTVVSALDTSASTNIADPTGRVLSVRGIVEAHIEHKGALARQHRAPGFLLLYVRPPSRGASDMKPTAFREAVGRIAGTAGTDRLWLGAAMIDWTTHRPAPQVHLVTNAAAHWPPGLSAELLEHAGVFSPT